MTAEKLKTVRNVMSAIAIIPKMMY